MNSMAIGLTDEDIVNIAAYYAKNQVVRYRMNQNLIVIYLIKVKRFS